MPNDEPTYSPDGPAAIPLIPEWSAGLSLLELTLPAPADNLALDEALLEQGEAEPGWGCLRFWESRSLAVVVGRSQEVARETLPAACHSDRVPIYRRHSGGGAVLLGPGCLMYTLVLPLTEHCRALGIPGVTQLILGVMAAGLNQALRATPSPAPAAVSAPGTTSMIAADPEGERIAAAGLSDLVDCGRKFSGNSQRWGRSAILHHGTLLYGFPLELIPRYLASPSRQPEYRAGRPHADFVTNVPLSRAALVTALTAAWRARDDEFCPPMDRVAQLARERYRLDSWNLQR